MINSSPSCFNSVPAYFPYRTMSPTLTVVGLSFVPFPTATTVPFCGFSCALSGIIIPDAVLVSASDTLISTLSVRV